MRLKISKVGFLVAVGFLCLTTKAQAINLDYSGFDKGALRANQITTDCSRFSLNLSCADANVQHALETLDQLVASGGSSQWTTSGSNIYSANAGNVGIGSTTPTQKLDVNGNIRSNTILTNGTGAGLIFSPGGIEMDPVNFSPTGANPNPTFTINTNGNVGIGTTLNPPGLGSYNAALGVKGISFLSNIASQSSSASVLGFDLNGSNFGVFYQNPADSTLSLGATTDYTIAPVSAMQSWDFDTGLTTISSLSATALKIPGNSVANNYVWTSTGTDGSAHWAASAGGGSSLWTTGNVGINTTSNVGISSTNPGQKLDVQGTVRATGFSLGGVTTTTVTGTGALTLGTAPTITSPVITNIAPAADFTITNNSVAAFTSVNSGATVNTLYLKAGNVGIGSVTPGQSLDAQGTIRALGLIVNGSSTSSSWVGSNVGIGTTLTGSTLLNVAGGVSVGTTNAGYFNAPSNGLIVQGNVGIGTTAPQSGFTLGSNYHLGSTGTAPTVASNDCGSTSQGSVSSGSTDLRGTVVVGTLTVTSCAITFNTAFGRAPICLTQDDTNILGTKNTQTTTKLTITSTTSMSSDTISWVCFE